MNRNNFCLHRFIVDILIKLKLKLQNTLEYLAVMCTKTSLQADYYKNNKTKKKNVKKATFVHVSKSRNTHADLGQTFAGCKCMHTLVCIKFGSMFFVVHWI